MTAPSPLIRQTRFASGSSSVTFGILWPDGSAFMTDWTRESVVSEIGGAKLTVYQFRGFKPRRVTHRLYLETTADFQSLDLLVQQAGSLTVFHTVHTAPTVAADQHAIHGQMYDSVDCRLVSLNSLGVTPGGSVEAEATFLVTS